MLHLVTGRHTREHTQHELIITAPYDLLHFQNWVYTCLVKVFLIRGRHTSMHNMSPWSGLKVFHRSGISKSLYFFLTAWNIAVHMSLRVFLITGRHNSVHFHAWSGLKVVHTYPMAGFHRFHSLQVGCCGRSGGWAGRCWDHHTMEWGSAVCMLGGR